MGDFAPGPLLRPLIQAHKIKEWYDDQQYQKEQREQNRQLMRLKLEDAQRSNARADLDTALHLHAMGAIPTLSGQAGQAQAGLAGKETVTAPGGKQYSLPSLDEQAASTGRREGITAAGKLEGEEAAKRKTGAIIDMPFPKIPGLEGAPATVPVDRNKIQDYVRDMNAIKGKRWSHAEFKTDKQTGKTVFFGIDDNGETTEHEMSTVMSPEQPKLKTGISAGAQSMLESTQKLIDEARMGPKPLTEVDRAMMGPEGEKQRNQAQVAKLEAARAAAKQAVAAHPDELEYGESKDSQGYVWPSITPKTKGGSAEPTRGVTSGQAGQSAGTPKLAAKGTPEYKKQYNAAVIKIRQMSMKERQTKGPKGRTPDEAFQQIFGRSPEGADLIP